MATYKEIKGVTVQTLDSDPELNVGSWSSGGALNTARYRGGSSGTTTAGLVYTGRTPTYVGNTESYNGTSWTEVNDVNNNSYAGGGSPAGSYTAALKSSGKSGPSSFQTNTEVWDGSSWTEVNNNNTGRDGIMGAGTSTSNIIAGGQTPPNQVIAESWNGTSWTEVGDLNAAKGFHVSWGSSNSNAIVTTGEGDGAPSGYGQTTETWNGSSWTETTDVNSGRTQGGGFGSTSTDGILTGGYYGPGYQSSTESWNGTTWTEVNDMSVARGLHFGSGTNGQAGFVAGGNPVKSDTEEWAFPPPTAAVLTEGSIFLSGGTTLKGFGRAAGIPAGTWSSGGSLNTGRYLLAGDGQAIPTTFAVGGTTTTYTAVHEQYNGSAWTEVADLNTARNQSAAVGTQPSAINFGGFTPPATGATESWNGSAWAETSDLNTVRYELAGAGANNTSALAFGGSHPSFKNETENWDGSSWTEVNNLNTARLGLGGAGTATAALAISGEGPGSTNVTNVEQWDGSSWTEIAEVNQARRGVAASGITTSSLFFGGHPSTGYTEFWNGSSWTELSDLSSNRRYLAGGGSSGVTSIAFGGGPSVPGTGSLTEEWTADAALSTVTVS